MQLDLFESIQKAYVKGPVSNAKLYTDLVESGALAPEDLQGMQPVGREGKVYQCTKRRVRWIQQTLKQLGVLEPAGARGHWKLTAAGRKKLTPAEPRRVLVAFSTDLGIALWANCQDVFARLDEPISLAISSPPYPLAHPRDYGNPSESTYVDWICEMLEPIVKNLVPGGSVVLNLSNEIFLPKSPARSLYAERMMIALNERLGLYKMDSIVWSNPCKPPGPIQWASKERFHLNVAWEPVYWLTNDPLKVRSNNQRVLEPHSAKHLALIRQGGEKTERINGDGSQRVKIGAYGRETAGRIPRNLMTIRHNCMDQARYKAFCRSVGLPSHGAAMPLELAKKLIGFLTEVGGLVVDLFGGSITTGKACEELGHRWLVTERMREYLQGGASRFHGVPGFRDYMTQESSFA